MGRYIFADVVDGRDKDQAIRGIQVDVKYIIPNSTWSTFELYVFLKKNSTKSLIADLQFNFNDAFTLCYMWKF